MPSYRQHLLSYVDRSRLKPIRIVSNPGNGGAGLIVDLLQPDLPFEFVKVHHEPDGTFPHGVPNPMLEENRAVTAEAVLREKASIGIAFDGDYDRCFFFDEQGTFIEGYYIVGLLASVFLKRHPGGKIVHDPRLTWNTLEIVEQFGGTAVQCKSGHAFIKQVMREVDAVYGGEMSAHHYFREFSYCDSGIIPWLVMAQLLSETGQPLSALIGERMRRFPASGEINRKLVDQKAAIEAVKARYVPKALKVESVDGLSVEFDQWRFNLRSSNTEPLVRLNVETRGDAALMQDKTQEILALLQQFA
jgi:phosphomannomutase